MLSVGCGEGTIEGGEVEEPILVEKDARINSGGTPSSGKDATIGGPVPVPPVPGKDAAPIDTVIDKDSGGPVTIVDSGNASACTIPLDAKLEDVSAPTTVIGTGTPTSCTGAAFVAAVAKGGVITFNCGPDPVIITLSETAKLFNNRPNVVIDGGGKVTLSGGGAVRILYQNTCDQKQVWTTSHCDDQDHPLLTVQNLTFADGNGKSDDRGGGAIYASGGRLKVINSRFLRNVCSDVGPDVGGAAIRAFQQSGGRPLYVINSVFENGVCSNGGGLSSIGVSYAVINSTFRSNQAIGRGQNPALSGTPGGGSGGAIYNDGDTYTLSLCGVTIENNTANEGGGAIFFVSNDLSGSLRIEKSTLRNNKSGQFETAGYPGIFVLSKDGNKPLLTDSTISK